MTTQPSLFEEANVEVKTARAENQSSGRNQDCPSPSPQEAEGSPTKVDGSP